MHGYDYLKVKWFDDLRHAACMDTELCHRAASVGSCENSLHAINRKSYSSIKSVREGELHFLEEFGRLGKTIYMPQKLLMRSGRAITQSRDVVSLC